MQCSVRCWHREFYSILKGACKEAFLKEHLFLFVVLIFIFFWPAKSECARAKPVSAISHIFPFFAVLIKPDLIHTIFAKTLVLIFRTTHLIHRDLVSLLLKNQFCVHLVDLVNVIHTVKLRELTMQSYKLPWRFVTCMLSRCRLSPEKW